MTKFIKVLPMVAVFAVMFIFAGKAMMKEVVVQTTQNWVYDATLPSPSGCDPTKPECYTLYSGTNFGLVCELDEEVCGIVAPMQIIAGQQRPVIDLALKALIEANQAVTGKIYLGPKIEVPSK